MRRAAFRAAVAAVALAAAGPGAAQLEIDPNAPVEISADEMEWKNEERIAVARGNADAVQGPYHLHADRLTAHLSHGSGADGAAAERIRLIEADGNVRLVTPGEVASGARGAYDVEKGLVFIEGDVVLTQGANVVRGDRLDMNLGTGVSRITAGASRGGRVAAVFAPGSDGDEDGDDGANGGADE